MPALIPLRGFAEMGTELAVGADFVFGKGADLAVAPPATVLLRFVIELLDEEAQERRPPAPKPC